MAGYTSLSEQQERKVSQDLVGSKLNLKVRVSGLKLGTPEIEPEILRLVKIHKF